jgi:hypothetical protein
MEDTAMGMDHMEEGEEKKVGETTEEHEDGMGMPAADGEGMPKNDEDKMDDMKEGSGDSAM